MSITSEQNIWFPGVYDGRTELEYAQIVSKITEKNLVELVQKRAKEDGEWSIAKGFVGDNEDKMHRMMAFVSDEENVRQCREHIYKEEMEHERTVDYVCRELANASKFMIR